MKFITNAFSINMIESPPIGQSFGAKFNRITAEEAMEEFEGDFYKSVIGHADLAAVISAELDTPVPFNRESVKLRTGDIALVCQYSGPRLPIGCRDLPAGAQIDYFLVEVQ